MADDDVTPEADEGSDDDADELEEADEESFPASDPPATWSGRKRTDEAGIGPTVDDPSTGVHGMT
jgi:hypothetical protein